MAAIAETMGWREFDESKLDGLEFRIDGDEIKVDKAEERIAV